RPGDDLAADRLHLAVLDERTALGVRGPHGPRGRPRLRGRRRGLRDSDLPGDHGRGGGAGGDPGPDRPPGGPVDAGDALALMAPGRAPGAAGRLLGLERRLAVRTPGPRALGAPWVAADRDVRAPCLGLRRRARLGRAGGRTAGLPAGLDVRL